MSTKQTPSTPTTPLERFKKTYAPLYRTLLILGILAVLISLASVTNITQHFAHFGQDPFYALSGIIATLIVLPLMIASIILLIHKHPTGIRLRLTGYAVSIIALIIGLFSSESTLQRVTDQVLETAKQNGNTVITPELAASTTEVTFYGSIYLSIAASLLFAWLWWKAWKKQVTRDQKKK